MLTRRGIGSARSGASAAYVTLPWTKRVQTVCFWTKPNQSGPYNVWDVDNGSTGWLQVFANAGALDVWCDNSPSQIYTQAGVLVSGMWTWVGVIGNGASSFILWKRATDSTVTVAAMTENGSNPITGMWLGSDGFGGENGDGSYKHFKLWDRVMTPRELIRESLQGEPVSRRGLHSYLPMRSGQSDGGAWSVNKGSTIWTRSGAWLNDRSQPPIPDVLLRGRRALSALTTGGTSSTLVGAASYSSWTASAAASEAASATGAAAYSAWAAAGTSSLAADAPGAALYDAWSASGPIDGLGATTGTGTATYSAWQAAGAVAESHTLTAAPSYAGWGSAGTASEAGAAVGTVSYSAWAAAAAASEAHALTGAGLYDAWSASAFDVLVPSSALAQRHGRLSFVRRIL
jgi:hypothetical protein